MRDSEMVAAVVAGDPAGLAAAYDRYAPALHTYCRSLLAEPADAADAVQDTFVIAASRLAGLRDADRLKPWLYAVARNECYRRLRSRAKMADLAEIGDISDDSAPAETGASRGELRALVQAAVAGLNQGDREVIELNLRHDLDGADLADALGVKPNQAHALQSRARGQLERSLGALLVARTGRESCPELAALLTGWDGQLNVLLRKRVSRHVEQCDECGQRKRRELSPAMLLSALPLVVLPPGLRQQVLRLVADVSPDAVSYRAGLARRAGKFRPDGFPVSVAGAAGRRPGRRPGLANLLAAAGLLAAGVVFVLAMMLAWPLRHTAATYGLSPSAGPPAAPASVLATDAASGSPSPVATGSGPATATQPAVAASSPASSRSAPAPSPSASRTHVSTPTLTPTPPPGRLSADPDAISLVPLAVAPGYSGSFTLTATGGRVATFTITVPAADAAGLIVTPATGSLGQGHSVTITVTTAGNGPVAYLTPLTIGPGGLTVDIRYPPRG